VSVHKTKYGKWSVRYRDNADRQKSRNFTERRDALAFDREVRRQKESRGLVLVDQGSVVLSEFIEGYWVYKHDLSEQTQRTYRSYYDRYVHPFVGGMELRELAPRVLLAWKTDLETSGVGKPTIRKVMTFLQGALSYAVLQGELSQNPMREIPSVSQERKVAPWPYTPTEVEAIRGVLSPHDATLVSVLGYSGLRPGEALRLRWEDVRESTLSVKDTKRQRERSAILLPTTAQDLREWQFASGTRTGPVFDLAQYTTVGEWRNWNRYVWKPALEDALPVEQDDKRPYRLRSTCASLMLADSRWSLAEIAFSMGHSLQIMSSHYANLISEFQGRQINVEDEIRKARQERRAA